MTDPPTPALDVGIALARYLGAIRGGRQSEATAVALDLLEQGGTAEWVVTEVLARAMSEVGQGWQRDEWSIAQEHRATTITESVLVTLTDAAMRADGAPVPGSRGRAVVACCEQEWHTLPGRMASHVLRMRGADAEFIGPSVPAEDLASFLGEDPLPAVAVTCSQPQNLSGAWRTVSELRASGQTIVCGGRGFGQHGRWGWALGVDRWAADFSQGADLLMEAMQQPLRAPRAPMGDPTVVAELHLLGRIHDELAGRHMASILRRHPELTLDDAALLSVRPDLAGALQVVESATVVGDPTVATDYVAWLEDVLRARSLATSLVATAFDSLLEVLPREVTRTRTMALTARAACGRDRGRSGAMPW